MKFLIFTAILLFASFASRQTSNPLRDTKWDGTDGLSFYFTTSDTLKMMVNNQLINSTQYKVKDSILSLKEFRISDATCDTSIKGSYIYRIKEDVLSFKVLSDRCDGRANIIQTLVLIKR